MKLALKPTKEQKALLAQMAGCFRFTYNKAVGTYLKKGNTHRTVYHLRDRFVTEKDRTTKKLNNFLLNKQWLKTCPKSARQKAIKLAISNIKACFSNLKAGNIKRFRAPFKRKKLEEKRGWAIDMEKKDVSKEGDTLSIFSSRLGPVKYCSKKQLHKLIPGDKPDHDCRIQKTQFNEYFLVLSIPVYRRDLKPPHSITSIDPGVRKPLTSYSPDKEEAFMFGKGFSTQLMTLLIQLDKLYSERDTAKSDSKKKKQLQRKITTLRKRVFYMKKEFRDQVSGFIANRYDVVLMPKLDTKDMTLASNRTLKTKVVRAMLGIGHSMIFKRLEEKCWEYGTTFLPVKEHYTSQTCLSCGSLNKCGETYHCKCCGFTADRDLLGSANILMKAIRL